MLKEDNILNSRFGKKNHFQVPAGYFDGKIAGAGTPHHSHAA